MLRNRGFILVLSLAVALVSFSCGEHSESPLDDKALGELEAPVFDAEALGMTELDDGSYLLAEPGKTPVRLIIPERPEGVPQHILPDGIFKRPEVDLISITVEEQEEVYLDKEASYATEDKVFVRATGSMAEKLSYAGPNDALMMEDTPGFIVNEVLHDGDDILFSVIPFHIAHVVWGNFRLEWYMKAPDTKDLARLLEDEKSPHPEPEVNEDGIQTVRQAADVEIPGDVTFSISADTGTEPNKIELSGEVGVVMDIGADVKGTFEGRIAKYVGFNRVYLGEGYTCRDPDDMGWNFDFCVDKIQVWLEAQVDDFEVGFNAQISGSIFAEDLNRREFNGLPGIPIPGVPLLEIAGIPYFKWGASMSASAQMSLSDSVYKGSGNIPFGFDYRDNHGFYDGFAAIPNKKPGSPRMTFEGDMTWGEFSTTPAIYSATAFIEPGFAISAGITGIRAVRLTGADIGIRGSYNIEWDPFSQRPAIPCLNGTGSVVVKAEPNIAFVLDIGVKTWRENLFCEDMACGVLATDNLLPEFNVPRQYWSHRRDECRETPEYRELIIDVVSSEPMGIMDVEGGHEIDSICVTRPSENGLASTGETFCATSGPSKLQGRPNSQCGDNYGDEVALINGRTTVRFGRNLRAGDVVDIVRSTSGNACTASGTLSASVRNADGTKSLGTFEANAALPVP